MHKSVLLKEVLKHLKPKNGDVIVDCTLGCGGHAIEILKKISRGGCLVGIDQDRVALDFASKRFAALGLTSYKIAQGNFRKIELILRDLGIKKVNGVLLDLGVSSLQLDDPGRGFSFAKDGPLDMRMDKSSYLTAYWVINKYHEEKLREIISAYGQERYARTIARAIVRTRGKKSIETTHQLREAVYQAVRYKYRKSKIHPATRTFQAIRIEVNSELSALSEVLEKLPSFLEKKARVCVISFHSLEDRIVKIYFKSYARREKYRLLTKKPLVTSFEEIYENPRSRSAKMRVAEFIG